MWYYNTMLVILPLSVKQSKKKNFILNLNNYRNAHHCILSNTKLNYKELILPLIPHGYHFDKPVKFTYTYFHGNKRRVDVSNPCSIIDKFVSDVLVDRGVLPDDNTDHLKRVEYVWGGVDKDNPRCELEIRLI